MQEIVVPTDYEAHGGQDTGIYHKKPLGFHFYIFSLNWVNSLNSVKLKLHETSPVFSATIKIVFFLVQYKQLCALKDYN